MRPFGLAVCEAISERRSELPAPWAAAGAPALRPTPGDQRAYGVGVRADVWTPWRLARSRLHCCRGGVPGCHREPRHQGKLGVVPSCSVTAVVAQAGHGVRGRPLATWSAAPRREPILSRYRRRPASRWRGVVRCRSGTDGRETDEAGLRPVVDLSVPLIRPLDASCVTSRREGQTGAMWARGAGKSRPRRSRQGDPVEERPDSSRSTVVASGHPGRPSATGQSRPPGSACAELGRVKVV